MKKFTFDDMLLETSQHFEAQGLNVFADGYREVSSNPTLLEDYIEYLTTNVSANSEDQIKQLMENTNRKLLNESSITGITPIASLSMPVIRKLWPRFALKDALKTEVPTAPRFTVVYTEPYMFTVDSNGKTVKESLLPGALGTAGSRTAQAKREHLSLELTSSALSDNAAGVESFTGTVTNTNNTWPLAQDIQLTTLAVSGTDITDASFNVYEKLDVTNGLRTTVSTTLEGTAAGTYEWSIFGEFDLDNGAYKVVVITPAIDVSTADIEVVLTFDIPVSHEYNETSYSVGFDVKRRDIIVPAGQHINAPLPIEFLNDTMATYQIDATKEIVDIMTNIVGQKLDLEVLEFIDNEIAKGATPYSSGSEYLAHSSTLGSAYTFDVMPAAGYAGDPKSWREMLKPVIDHLATSIINKTYFTAGQFVIVGNPLDCALLTNVDWTFKGSDQTIDGVDVNYNIGTFLGAHSYRVVSSPNVSAGTLRMIFIPSASTQMTYKYYPYTFNVEHRYLDPNRPNVPSIMMTKRHQFASFLPACGSIVIKNNNGYSQFPQAVDRTWGAA